MEVTRQTLAQHGFLFRVIRDKRAVVIRNHEKPDGTRILAVDAYALDDGRWVAFGCYYSNRTITEPEDLLEQRPELRKSDYAPAMAHVDFYCHECGELLRDMPVTVGKKMFCRECGVRFSDPCPECKRPRALWVGDHVAGTLDCTIGLVRCTKCRHEWYAYRDLRPYNRQLLVVGSG